jgi:hypothetical protein
MPKLPKNIFPYVTTLLLLLLIGVVVFYLANQSKSRTPKVSMYNNLKVEEDFKPDPEIASYFNGEVVSINKNSKSLEVRDSQERTIKVTLASKSMITAGPSKVDFDTIKVGDRVTLYSNISESVQSGVEYEAEWVDIFVPVDLSKLDEP